MDMVEFFTDYVWPVIIMVAQSVLLLVLLLIVTAWGALCIPRTWLVKLMLAGTDS
jgi:hypothetical protein